MLKIKEWLKTKNNALFEIKKMNSQMKILTVSRLTDNEVFSFGDIVKVGFMPDSYYRIFSFSSDLIHVTLIQIEMEFLTKNALPLINIKQLEHPTLEEIQKILGENK